MKTNEVFGGLSNMSGEYPIAVNGVRIMTSEHLYQALKFPDRPEIQKAILNRPSPIACDVNLLITNGRIGLSLQGGDNPVDAGDEAV